MNAVAGVGNPRFFTCTGPHALAAVAAAAGCKSPTRDVLITGLAALETAAPDQITFIVHKRLLPKLEQTRAGAVLVPADMQTRVPAGSVALVVANPSAAWAQVAAFFYPAPGTRAGVHPSAVVAGDAVVDPSAEIGPHVVIGARAEIGARCQIGAGTVISDGVVLGADCRIAENVTISHAVLGARVRLFPGVRVGQEGFGFTMGSRGFVTTPQLARVLIGDDVELGANTTIDRGALHDTVIGTGTRIDNLVQVGHGVKIGRYCAISGQAGLSGSCEIEDYVVIAGQVGIADHIKVGTKARVGAQAGVMSEIEPGASVVGSPAKPVREMFREVAVLKRLAQQRGKTGGDAG